MRALPFLFLVATPALAVEGVGFRMTVGWLSVMDVPGVQRVQSWDDTRVVVQSVTDDQVLLLGVDSGNAMITVWANGARTEYELTVLRNTSVVEPLDGIVKASVGHRLTLNVKDLKRLALGDAALFDATPTGPGTFEISPRRPGTTTLFVWAGGLTAKHRKSLMVTVEGGFARSTDEVDGAFTEPAGRLVLVSGEHALVDLPPNAMFAIKDESVVVARASEDGELILEGQKPGATRVLLWLGHKRAKSMFVVVHPRAAPPPAVDDPGIEGGPKAKASTPI